MDENNAFNSFNNHNTDGQNQPVQPVGQPEVQPTQPEQVVAQSEQQVQQVQPDQPTQQFVQTADQTVNQPVTSQPVGQPEKNKKSSLVPLLIGGIVLVALIVLGIVFLPKLFGGNGNGGGGGGGGSSTNYSANKITTSAVNNYCEAHEYKKRDTESNHTLSKARESVLCVKDNGYIQIAFAHFDGSAEDREEVQEVFEESRIKTHSVEVYNENGHKEYVTDAESLNIYIIVDGELFFYAIAYNTDDFEGILNEVRGESALNSKYKEMIETKNVSSGQSDVYSNGGTIEREYSKKE